MKYKFINVFALNEFDKNNYLNKVGQYSNSNDYDKVSCKTLVIGAEYDGINPPELGREVADGIDGAEFELINDAGHLAFAEQPDEFYNVIKNFLDN